MGLLKDLALMILPVVALVGYMDYRTSGTFRSSDGKVVEVSRNLFPYESVTYARDKEGPDWLMVYRPYRDLNDAVMIYDYDRDGRPDEIVSRNHKHTRFEDGTEDLFHKVNDVWDQYRRELDVEKKIEQAFSGKYNRGTPDDAMDLL
ncbi:MAG: hypothetical protein V1729_06510 [Candidatus Woesearchaeota archaeon]